MTFKVIIELSPGLPCPGAIHDLSQGKWVAILLNVVKDVLGILTYSTRSGLSFHFNIVVCWEQAE